MKYSYLLLASVMLAAGCKSTPQNESNDDYKTVGLNAVAMEGELQTRALRNFDRLESDIYTPEKVFPVNHKGPSEGWPGDYEGRVILALTLETQATHREPKYLSELIRMIPEKVNSLGYLGPIMKDSINEQQLSGHGWFLRGLCEYYEWKKDTAVKTYIGNIIQNLVLPTKGHHKKYPINPSDRIQHVGAAAGTTLNALGNWQLSTDIGCNFIFMDGVIHAYALFPSPALKDLVDEMIGRFFEMDLVAIKAQTHATLTGLRGIIRYYETNQNATLLNEAEKRFELYRTLAMTENYENFNWFGRPEWTEPCAIVDAYMVATQLWQHTKKNVYIQDAHKIYYNGLGHTQRTNGGFGLDNCPGATDNTLRVLEDEAYWCCTMRGGEGLARAIQYNYFTGANKVIIPFFHSGTATIELNNQKLSLKQTSTYPYEGRVSLEVLSDVAGKEKTISLFLPDNATEPQIKLNGKEQAITRQNGMVNATFQLAKGDKIDYLFTMQATLTNLVKHSDSSSLQRVMYGPLVLGYQGSSSVSLPVNTGFEKTGERTWKVKNTNIELTPVFHLLDANVKKSSDYNKQVLFATK